MSEPTATDRGVRLAEDVLWGVDAIAREIGRSKSETYALLNNGHLPGAKIGRLWGSTRSVLRARIEMPERYQRPVLRVGAMRFINVSP